MKVHFGYRDGFSQPEVAWEAEVLDDESQAKGLLHRRHFLLGYSAPTTSSAPNSGASADYFRDSSYLILRWMKQDVGTFEGFLTEAAPHVAAEFPLDDSREYVAAKMMGRWRWHAPDTFPQSAQSGNEQYALCLSGPLREHSCGQSP